MLPAYIDSEYPATTCICDSMMSLIIVNKHLLTSDLGFQAKPTFRLFVQSRLLVHGDITSGTSKCNSSLGTLKSIHFPFTVAE